MGTVNVAVVAGICVRRDAISNVVVDQIGVLTRTDGVDEVTLFTQGHDRPVDAPVVVTGDPWSMLVHQRFRRADLVVFHWGIAYELFDALAAVPGLGRRAAVHFHNVTPTALLVGHDLGKAERSTLQGQFIADSGAEVWTYSEYNRRTLLEWGVPSGRLFHVPFSIVLPTGDRVERPAGRVELLTVGRLVPAKGLHVLVDALGRMPAELGPRLRLTIAGSLRLSDDAYVAELRRQIAETDLGAVVTIVDDPDDTTLWELYGGSHVVVSPSFHEGLCVPVIEGYLAGCRAIGTTGGNLPFLVQPPDPVVPVGDAVALAEAIARVAGEVLDGVVVAGPPIAATAFSPERAAAALRERVLAQVTP